MNNRAFVKFTSTLEEFQVCILYSLYSLTNENHTKEQCIKLVQPYLCKPKLYTDIVSSYDQIPFTLAKDYPLQNKPVSGKAYIAISNDLLERVNQYIKNNFTYTSNMLIDCTPDRYSMEYRFTKNYITTPVNKIICAYLEKNHTSNSTPSSSMMNKIKDTIEQSFTHTYTTCGRISDQLRVWASVIDFLTSRYALTSNLIMFGRLNSLRPYIGEIRTSDLYSKRKKIPTEFSNDINIPIYSAVYVNPFSVFNGELPLKDTRIIVRYLLSAGTKCFIYPPQKYNPISYSVDTYLPEIEAILAPHTIKIVTIHKLTLPEQDEVNPGNIINVRYIIIDVEITKFIDIIPESKKVPITTLVQTLDTDTKMDILVPS